MMRVETVDYLLRFSPVKQNSDIIDVIGDLQSLETFRDSVLLAGQAEDDPTQFPLEEVPGGTLRCSRATVALFLSFEVLNTLDVIMPD